MTSAVRDVESGVKHVESELNAAAADAPAPTIAPPPPAAAATPEPAPAADAPRQGSLPGFDRG
jgi:hypothetical protein